MSPRSTKTFGRNIQGLRNTGRRRNVSCRCVGVPAQKGLRWWHFCAAHASPSLTSTFYLVPRPRPVFVLFRVPCILHTVPTHGPRSRRTLQLQEFRDRTLPRLERQTHTLRRRQDSSFGGVSDLTPTPGGDVSLRCH